MSVRKSCVLCWERQSEAYLLGGLPTRCYHRSHSVWATSTSNLNPHTSVWTPPHRANSKMKCHVLLQNEAYQPTSQGNTKFSLIFFFSFWTATTAIMWLYDHIPTAFIITKKSSYNHILFRREKSCFMNLKTRIFTLNYELNLQVDLPKISKSNRQNSALLWKRFKKLQKTGPK